MRPGVLDVRANVLRPVNAFTKEDLPTLDRPAKAISGNSASGNCANPTTPSIKSHGPANTLRAVSNWFFENSSSNISNYFFFFFLCFGGFIFGTTSSLLASSPNKAFSASSSAISINGCTSGPSSTCFSTAFSNLSLLKK